VLVCRESQFFVHASPPVVDDDGSIVVGGWSRKKIVPAIAVFTAHR